MFDPQGDPDEIEFENINICDPKHVETSNFQHRRSIICATFADPSIELVDVKKMMETGLNIARFKTSHSTRSEKVKLLKKFDKAASFLSSKHGLLAWPCATCIELKTCVVKTGMLEDDVFSITIAEDTEIILTCDVNLFNKCNQHQIFVDNPYLTAEVTVGMTISLGSDAVTAECTAILSPKSISCYVTKGGQLQNLAYVCMRGAKRISPYLAKQDLHIIRFAIEYQVDMLIINYARHADTLKKIKQYLGSKVKRPILVAGISTEEGLDNIDGIVKEADAIIFSREYFTYEIPMHLFEKLGIIQRFVAAKCRESCKPFFISGGVFRVALSTGVFHSQEYNDITNAILDGAAGFVLRETANIDYLIAVMKTLNTLCASVEPLTNDKKEFFRNVSQLKMPLNAAEACAVSCALVANENHVRVIVCPTVTGRTAYLLNWLRPINIIIAVTTKIRTMRLLNTQRSVIALLYKGTAHKSWFRSVQARVRFAIEYAVKKHWIRYGDPYVTLEKGTEVSSFCDCVRVWKVTTVQQSAVECPDSLRDFKLGDYIEPPPLRKRSISAKKENDDDELNGRDLDTILAEAMQRSTHK
ncbi:unnamed protein product [Chrysodeixis includens]|uniref:Pyruvate kinase n=1 Tax=Chrysodeixis includens TaxID=689277 RepID=A0A9P0FX62_CHRIL|nr:unnamed protein product [Chrysodeixis includens]